MTTLLAYAKAQAEASATGMKHAVVAYALTQANGYLPAEHPNKIKLDEARKQVKADLKAMNEATAKAISTVFPRLGTKLVKRHGKPGGTVVEGERQFWDALAMPPAEAVAIVLADMRADGWNGTWQGLREYCGFKKAPTKDDLAKFLANLKSAVNRVSGDDPDIGADDILRDDKARQAVAGAIVALTGLLTVAPTFESDAEADLAEAA
jgi:hypothetical protein